MPIVQAQGAFSVGRDCQVVIQHPLAPNGRVDLPNVTGFRCKQIVANVKSDRLDGIQLSARLPKGWEGSFMMDRGSSGADDFFALLEAGWYATGMIQAATVYQFIAEVSGAQSTYQFTSVSMTFDDPGTWKGDAKVDQTIAFEAFRRLKV